MATTHGLRASWIMPAIFLSCAVMPMDASITSTQRSARRMLASERMTEKTSTLLFTFPRGRMPAVSMSV